MSRVLLLCNSGSNLQTQKAISAIHLHLGGEFEFDVRSIGPRGDFRSLPAAVIQLRNREYDIIHAFSFRTLIAAIFCKPSTIVFSPSEYVPVRQLRLFRTLIHRATTVVFESQHQRESARKAGIDIGICQVIRPPVETKERKSRDESLRGALGLGPDDFVLLAPGESTREAAHDEAVWATGILNVLDDRYKLLLWGRGLQAKSAAQLAYRLKQGGMVRSAESMLGKSINVEQLFAAADACLVTAHGYTSVDSIAGCMLSGLPIVSTTTPITAELLRNEQNALLLGKRSPRLLAQRVLDLRQNPTLGKAFAARAREDAQPLFSAQTFITCYRQVYSQ